MFTDQVPKFLGCALVAGLLVLGGACKEPEKKQGGSKKEASDNALPSDGSGSTGSTTGGDEGSSDDSESNNETTGEETTPVDDCDKTSGLTLTTSDNYDDHIKSILAAKCVTCHTAGKDSPNLSTYAKLQSAKSQVETKLSSSEKHPTTGTQLTSDEKSKITAWLAAGAPETAADAGGSSNTSSDTTTTGTGCGESSNSEDVASGWEELINPPKLQECKTSGKIYDRSGEKCHKAEIAKSYECTRSGIISKFKALGIDVTSQLDKMDTDQYVIDQCGEFNKEPIVYFYKKSETGDELNLQLRKICKKGSAACENN